MKTYSLILLSLLYSSAHAFETGKYRGETADGSQYCELDLVQYENSYFINTLNCEDLSLERTIESEPKELFYGKTKKYFAQYKMTMSIEVAPNLYKMNYSNKKKTDSYDKELIAKDENTIHFNFSITQQGQFDQWFDLDLKKKN